MAYEDVDVEQAQNADQQGNGEHQTGEQNDEAVGNESSGQQDWSQDLVVHDIEDVIEVLQALVDEVWFVLFSCITHNKNLAAFEGPTP